MLVLGIETSCDESAAALVRDGRELLSSVVASQVDLHEAYGGVVPEIAARAHVQAVAPVVQEALAVSSGRPDAVAVTVGPGLVGSLVVGVSAAKAMAWAWGVPLVAVNHVEAHAMAPVLQDADLDRPFLALVVSGGHTLLAEVRGVDDMRVLGETRDDAVGEAYDKVAKFLGLAYPGGPVIDRLAREGNGRAIPFPRPMMQSGDYQFSMSGLKTAVIRYVQGRQAEGAVVSIPDVAASFQEAVTDVLVAKTMRAAEDRGRDKVVAGGGVVCNTALRARLAQACTDTGLTLVLPEPALCTDNAAMVASLGYARYAAGHRAGLTQDVFPSLRLGAPIPLD